MWVTDGEVRAIKKQGNTIYIGGIFNYVGPDRPYGALYRDTAMYPDMDFPAPNGIVYSCIADGSGGWFVAGNFTTMGGLPRQHLARINANGMLTSWNPGTNFAVYSIALGNGKLYIGGDFDSVGGVYRRSVAAIDTLTGVVSSWNPDGNYAVTSLAVNGNTIYAGGDFTTIGGQQRNGLAAISANTGIVTPWNPANTYSVNFCIVPVGKTVYIGGSFPSIGGQQRSYLAAIDSATGMATNWNPNVDGPISGMSLQSGILYICGSFNAIGTLSRSHLGAIDTATGIATNWNPAVANTSINTIATTANTVHVLGGFSNGLNYATPCIFSFDRATGNLLPRKINISDAMAYTITANGNDLYIGGYFRSLGGVFRKNAAALNATTGIATGWAPNVDSIVNTLAVDGSNIYIGGSYKQIGGQARTNLAVVDSATGAVGIWNPNINGTIGALTISNGLVYAGGFFDSVGGLARLNIAAINKTTAIPTPWSPAVTNVVRKIIVSGNNIFIGGLFQYVSGQPHACVAAIDATTGIPRPWNANASTWVLDIDLKGNTIYACGYFTSIGGQQRKYLAALDTATGLATPWNPTITGLSGATGVSAVAINGDDVYIGGASFDSVGNQPRNNLAAIDIYGNLKAWNPDCSGQVYTLCVNDTSIYAGGNFLSMSGSLRGRLAAFSKTAPSAIRETLATGNNAIIFPNPAHNDMLNFQLTTSVAGTYQLGLYNTLGQKVLTQHIFHAAPSETHTVHTPNLTTGTYIAILTDANGNIQMYNKWVKLN